MYSADSLRRDLADYFREKAAFRYGKAEAQEPHEGNKNECYAASLQRMAQFVEALPDDNPSMMMLLACPSLFEFDFFQIPRLLSESDNPYWQSEADKAAIHCGPRGSIIEPGECAAEFASWAKIVVEEVAS